MKQDIIKVTMTNMKIGAKNQRPWMTLNGKSKIFDHDKLKQVSPNESDTDETGNSNVAKLAKREMLISLYLCHTTSKFRRQIRGCRQGELGGHGASVHWRLRQRPATENGNTDVLGVNLVTSGCPSFSQALCDNLIKLVMVENPEFAVGMLTLL